MTFLYFFTKKDVSPCGSDPQPLYPALRHGERVRPQLEEAGEVEEESKAEDAGVSGVAAVRGNIPGNVSDKR